MAGELEGLEGLDRLLSDPAAMAKVMDLARSLSGEAGPPSGPPPGPSPGGPSSGGPPPGPTTIGGPPPGGPSPGGPPGGPSSGGPPSMGPSPGGPSSGGPPSMGPGPDGLSPFLRRLLPVLAEGQRDTDARRVLYALRPYLGPRRQEKVERALQLARLYRLGKGMLVRWEG